MLKAGWIFRKNQLSMAGPETSPEKLERHLSVASAVDPVVSSEHDSVKDPSHDYQPLSAMDQPTTTQAILGILSAVESISSNLKTPPKASSLSGSSPPDDKSPFNQKLPENMYVSLSRPLKEALDARQYE